MANMNDVFRRAAGRYQAPSSTTSTPAKTASKPSGSTPYYFSVSPPGKQPDPTMYSYQINPNAGWAEYPPGVPAPTEDFQINSPKVLRPEDLAIAKDKLDDFQRRFAHRKPGQRRI